MFHMKHDAPPGRPAITNRRLKRFLPLLSALALLGAACGRIASPTGWAAPELRNDTLYISPERGKLAAYKLDTERNLRDRLWEFPDKNEKVPLVVENGKNLPSPKSETIKFEGLYGDPVITDDGVYATAYSGHVIALGADGRARWVAALPGRMIGGVLVAGDSVYAGTTTAKLFALERSSGKVRWQAPAGDAIWSAPVQAGDLIVVTAMDGSARAFDRDGTRQWLRKVAEQGIASTPVVDGGRLYVGSLDKHIYAIDARNGETAWRSDPADNWFWTEILLQEDTLFAGSLGGTMYALDARSGAIRWSAPVGTMIRGRAALVDGILVVGTKDGRLHGLQPSDGARVWDVSDTPAPDDPTAQRGDLWADLVPLKDGVLAAVVGGGQGHVYVLDVGQRKVREVAPR